MYKRICLHPVQKNRHFDRLKKIVIHIGYTVGRCSTTKLSNVVRPSDLTNTSTSIPESAVPMPIEIPPSLSSNNRLHLTHEYMQRVLRWNNLSPPPSPIDPNENKRLDRDFRDLLTIHTTPYVPSSESP